MTRPRTRLALLSLGLAAVVAGAGWLLLRPADRPTDPTWLHPPGHWSRLPLAPGAGADARDGEAQAALLSLPYSAGGAPAPDARGVVHHDPELAVDGVNLYVSGHGPEAILLDMDGRYLHRWRRTFEETFPNLPPGRETEFWRRARLLDDGEILVLFQGGGIARLDRDSSVVWATPGAFFNDFDVEGGRVVTIGKTARIIPSVRPDEEVLEDFVAILDLATGARLESAPLLAAFERGGYGHVLEPLPSHADIFHSNTVHVLETPADGSAPSSGRPEVDEAFAAGNVLLSLREIDVLAVLDAELETILWARRGPWHLQHEPVVRPGRQLLLFDNRGGTEGRTRVLLWDLVAEREAWSFEAAGFDSALGGTVEPLEGGNLLVTSTSQGRAFELDPDGRVVWELVSPHRAGKNGELVAMLFEVQRLPRESVAWLGS